MTDEVQADLAGLQHALVKTDSVEQFLHELAVLSTRMVSDGLSCGMSLRYRGRPGLVTAGSDSLASAADEVQYQTGDGPCLYAMRHARPVLIDDTAAHDRWIRFCDQAAAAGLRSCYALPLIADGEPLGALILYSRQPSAFGPKETGQAVTFAGHASGALTLALRMPSYADLNDQLKSSIASRAVIDQATGVIMATEHCPQDRAFTLLRSVSRHTNVKLRDLAADIVSSVSGEPPRPAPRSRMAEALMNTWMRPWRASDAHMPLAGARSLVERTFRHADIPAVRRFAVEFGARAGIGTAQLADWVLAVNEAAACAVARGASTGRLRLWTKGARAFCAVSGDSMASHGPDGGRQGDVDALRRWLLNQLCDCVSVESGPDGVTVLLSISVT